MESEAIREQLDEENPEALTLDGFDEALIGIGRRSGQPALAVYSQQKIIEKLVRDGATPEEAQEHFEFNIAGSWVGEHTPLILEMPAV